jgi:hypothetical protein
MQRDGLMNSVSYIENRFIAVQGVAKDICNFVFALVTARYYIW